MVSQPLALPTTLRELCRTLSPLQGLLEVEAIQGPGAEELTDDSDYEGMPEDFRGPQDLPFGFN